MKNYELTAIIHPKKVEEGKQLFADIIKKYDVNITGGDDWGLKRLAYPIEDETEGYYLFKTATIKPETIVQLTREFRIAQPIIRSMFVVLNEKNTVKEPAQETEPATPEITDSTPTPSTEQVE